MPELSNLLRHGLSQAQNGTSAHPDADIITAYIEQSLPTAERQTVVAHLAMCEPCREIVVLSQPELAEAAVQTVLQPAPVSGWRRLFTPAFGIASAVAAMAIIAVAMLQLPHSANQQSASNQQAKVTAPAAQPVNQPEQPKAADQNSTPQIAERKEEAAASPSAASLSSAGKSYAPAVELDQKRSAATDQLNVAQAHQRRDEVVNVATANLVAVPAAPPAKSPVLTAGLKKDYVNTDLFANNTDDVVLDQSNAISAPQPEGAPVAKAFAANSKMSFADLPSNTSEKNQPRLLSPLRLGCTVCTKMAQATVHSLHLRGSNPPLRSSSLGDNALGGLGMFSNTLQKSSSAELAAAPGKTETSLTSSEALSAGALGYADSDSLPVAWRIAGGKLMKTSGQSWEDAYPATGIEFATVNARGKEVWAGGKNTVLIHSRDGGTTWETVRLGEGASGTVVSVAANSTGVQVRTSQNQLWLSTDGGKSWTAGSE